ncbi:transposase [Streptomyces sp. NBRC 110611]|uniref:transposase n=1 Tax=Streptomyces sp. NBRC 110611 TaxID=1621259 RepID=UPI0037DA3FCC
MYRAAEPKPAIRRMAEELGVHHEALRGRIRQAEADAGERDDPLTTEEKEELAQLRREVRELRRANEVLRTASALSPLSSTRPGPGGRTHRRAPVPGGRARTPGTPYSVLRLLPLAASGGSRANGAARTPS